MFGQCTNDPIIIFFHVGTTQSAYDMPYSSLRSFLHFALFLSQLKRAQQIASLSSFAHPNCNLSIFNPYYYLVHFVVRQSRPCQTSAATACLFSPWGSGSLYGTASVTEQDLPYSNFTFQAEHAERRVCSHLFQTMRLRVTTITPCPRNDFPK